MNGDDRSSRRNENQRGIQLRREQHMFSGPLPRPEILEGYERVIPGAAERILVMAEQQSAHRQSLETKAINSDIANSKLGLWLGFFIGTVGIISGAVVAAKGSVYAGSFISIGSLAALVSVFVYGSRRRVEERKERRAEALRIQNEAPREQ